MSQNNKFSVWKIILPTVIGMGVVLYMLWDNLFSSDKGNLESLKQISITWQMVFCFILALLFMVGRDLGFTIRYRYLTEKLLTWKQCLKVTLLAEFGTAITPSSVGGSSMAVIFLTKEKIPVGKSTTMVFVSLLLDEMFFVVAFPLLLLFLPVSEIFADVSSLKMSILALFVLAYIVKVAICICLIVGLFFKPEAIRWLLLKIFKIPFLRKWKNGAEKAGNDIVLSSGELKGKGLKYWFPLILATVLSWCSRYLVVNALFAAFFPVENHLLVFARQFVMWILMVLSITPGASGLSEIIFDSYLGALVPISALVPVIVILWRLLSYYNYLFIGAILVPRWVKTAFSKDEKQ